jgi:hypothetical protein
MKGKPLIYTVLVLFALLFAGLTGAVQAGFLNDAAKEPVASESKWIEPQAVPVAKSEIPTEPVPKPDSERLDQFAAEAPKSILELQPYRSAASIDIQDGTGRNGKATLVSLNPGINVWFLLELAWEDETEPVVYHLENRAPSTVLLSLVQQFTEGVQIESDAGFQTCDLWSAESAVLFSALSSGRPYEKLCEDKLYLRNITEGRKTTVEKVTDLLRRHVWGSEKIIDMVKGGLFQDAFLETSDVVPANASDTFEEWEFMGPRDPFVHAKCAGQCLITTQLALTLERQVSARALIGEWYPVKGVDGVFVSTMQPKLVGREVVLAQRGKVNALDNVESSALAYLVAFDLSKFEMGYELGTEHPRIDWSTRVPAKTRDDSLPGPDGVGSVAPLARTGIVSPDKAERIAATFTGGFKRYHGAFFKSDRALENHGTHYGFVENGVLLSKLQPGLATVIVDKNGGIDLKTWSDDDPKAVLNIRHARQNGVPIIDYDPATGTSEVGALVKDFLAGNWSASAEKNFRTVRAGLAIQEYEGRRYLIYAYFSSATTSAMARVFQAYHAKYAMILDMNALEHTYLAIYRNSDSHFLVEQLVRGMEVLDTTKAGEVIPRFVGYADNRDFFYLLRKEGS